MSAISIPTIWIDTTVSQYPAEYPLHKPDLFLGKRLGEDAKTTGGTFIRWSGEPITEKTYNLLLHKRTRAGSAVVLETTPASIGSILDSEKIDDRSQYTHWALRDIIDTTASSARKASGGLSEWQIEQMIANLDAIFTERIDALQKMGFNIPKTEPFMRRLVLTRLRGNPVWLFSLDRLRAYHQYIEDAIDLAILANIYADRQKLPPQNALMLVLGGLLRDVGVGYMDPEIVQVSGWRSRTKENEAIFRLQSVVGYSILGDDQTLSLMAGYAHEWEANPYGMRSCFKSLRRLGDKDALAGLGEDQKEELKSASGQRNEAIQKDAHILHLLHLLKNKRRNKENPTQIALLFAQDGGAFFVDNPDITWAFRSLIAPDGVLAKKDTTFPLSPAMISRNKYNATLCQEASEGIIAARMHPHFWARVVSARQSGGVIAIEYQLVQIVPGKTPINIAQYVDASKHSIRTLAGGKDLSGMIFEMELPELSVYYPKPKSMEDAVS